MDAKLELDTALVLELVLEDLASLLLTSRLELHELLLQLAHVVRRSATLIRSLLLRLLELGLEVADLGGGVGRGGGGGGLVELLFEAPDLHT